MKTYLYDTCICIYIYRYIQHLLEKYFYLLSRYIFCSPLTGEWGDEGCVPGRRATGPLGERAALRARGGPVDPGGGSI